MNSSHPSPSGSVSRFFVRAMLQCVQGDPPNSSFIFSIGSSVVTEAARLYPWASYGLVLPLSTSRVFFRLTSYLTIWRFRQRHPVGHNHPTAIPALIKSAIMEDFLCSKIPSSIFRNNYIAQLLVSILRQPILHANPFHARPPLVSRNAQTLNA